MLTSISFICSREHSYVGATDIDVKTCSKITGHFRVRSIDALEGLGEKMPDNK